MITKYIELDELRNNIFKQIIEKKGVTLESMELYLKKYDEVYNKINKDNNGK